MSEDKDEDSQSPKGESDLPSADELSAESVTNALSSSKIGVIDISKSEKGGVASKPQEMPHARGRLIVAGGALAISLIGPCLPFVPDNVRTGLLAIAGSISTSLFKGFEKH